MEKSDKRKFCPCFTCRCTKFVPVTTPRYNKAGVVKNIWMSDLKIYNEHRKRCFYARPKIDTKPPLLDLGTKIKPLLLYNDAYCAAHLDQQNKQLMKRLIEIERLGGLTDCVNSQINFHMSNWNYHKANMHRIQKENKEFHRRIAAVTSLYKYNPKEWKHFVQALKKDAHYPLIVFAKKDLDKEIKTQPSISTGLPTISNHVECFIDFTVENGEYLGRIILELYQEIAPLQCQNFLDFCESYSEQTTKNNIIIQRIVKDRYLESCFITNNRADIMHRKRNKKSPVVHQVHKLKHTRTGTISMIKDEKRMNNLKICITLCPMPQLDRTNVVFGKVTKGIGVLMKINGYSRKIGKPLETISISDCGKMPECICHKKMVECKPY
ncbi:uncharacterized protein LOC123315505 [Coccinella septempunctata]|uniref:uncharacterized protein LOC123315505 n=1 Tax=Coccinella septempunctata TaxID=41139 RepID=UPI001D081125|nr:uncharacterized protein LOC123315505 [Coccinella septempunctata]